ncbi:MAG: cytochrome c [Labilithrix sp.]|nr:cytochrome c [Labilithrix sp.]
MRTNHRWLATLTVALAAAAALASVPASAAPDTSLKDTMKKMQAQVLNGDAKPLAGMFDATKGKGKPEFANWAAISDKGKAAAAKGDLDGAKATCKECHDAYRTDFKTKYGSKAP